MRRAAPTPSAPGTRHRQPTHRDFGRCGFMVFIAHLPYDLESTRPLLKRKWKPNYTTSVDSRHPTAVASGAEGSRAKCVSGRSSLRSGLSAAVPRAARSRARPTAAQCSPSPPQSRSSDASATSPLPSPASRSPGSAPASASAVVSRWAVGGSCLVRCSLCLIFRRRMRREHRRHQRVDVWQHGARIVHEPSRDERIGKELIRDASGELRRGGARRCEGEDDRVARVDLECLVRERRRAARFDHRHHASHRGRLVADDLHARARRRS